jgi:hypothetical protein
MTRILRLQNIATIAGLGMMALGCTGSVGDGPGGGDTPGGTGPGGAGTSNPGGGGPGSGGGLGGAVNPSMLPSDAMSVPDVVRVRRLSTREYVNTIRDLLGVQVSKQDVQNFSADQDSQKAGFMAGGAVDQPQDVRVFMTAAESLANAALGKMAGLLPCSPIPTDTAAQDQCADKFLAGFAKRAYRRALLPAEVQDLSATYRAQRQTNIGADFTHAVANMIGAILQSPYFLYRHELGPTAPIKEGNLIRYNPYEVASQLSYMFWQSMPDDQLLTAADGNQLSNADQISKQAWRMLADPKAADALQDFALQWLQIGVLGDIQKDPSLKDYSPAVGDSMLKETRAFVANLFQNAKSDGKFETLLTSNQTFADANLAKIYGLQGGPTGGDLQPVTLDKTQRAGILTQGTFLTAKADADDSHLIKRGNAILTRLLCIPLEMPVNIDVPPLPEPKPGQTNRERVSIHSMSPCATCHVIIDPVGFAFENYDGIGEYRTTQENKPIDASGALPLDGGMIKFKNALEFVPQLAASQDAQTCMVKQMWRYSLRRAEVDTEAPSLDLIHQAFNKSGHDLRELLVAVTRTRSFAFRKPFPEEVMP